MAITRGDKMRPLSALANGDLATWFAAADSPQAARKQWIASMPTEGRLIVDEGAAAALRRGKSLLPAGVRRVEDMAGRSFAFTDETSTSGHIFPRMLLNRLKVDLGRVYFSGGHPNSVQAVWDGKAVGGSAFYSPPGAQQARDGTLVGEKGAAAVGH